MINLDIKLVLKLTRELESINHPNPSLIAKEICEFTNNNQKQSLDIVGQLSNDMPWEYVRGYAYFKDYKFHLNNSTLIPRVETEQIIDIFKDSYDENIKNVYDVGCGSGAIGITIAKTFPNLHVTLIDISKEALKVCKKNIRENEVGNVGLVNTNLLDGVTVKKNSAIIANLPYIPTDEYLTLQPSVLNFEPKSALDGGSDGLLYIKELLKQIKGGNINLGILEIDPSQVGKLTDMIKNDFPKYNLEFVKDYQGLFRFLKFNL